MTGHRSHWLTEALGDEQRHDDAPPLRGSARADVAIVGGGYVGLWTALRIKELDPAADVAILEADICGSGASGRNGGFVLSWWPKLASLVALCGKDEALRLVAASEQAIDEIETFAASEAPQAQMRRGGWLWTATSDAQLGAWNDVVALAEKLGSDAFVRLTPGEIRARSGSPQHLAGVLDRSGATVHPAYLARGLRRAALARGVRLFEHTKVTAIGRQSPSILHAGQGRLTADRVVIATNAWAVALRELRRHLFVISSDMIVTGPIPERLQEIGWTGGEAITDSQTLVCYYRTTADGRIAFGKGGWAIAFGTHLPRAMERHRGRAAMVARDFRRYYPMLHDVAVDNDWAGPIDRTGNSLPIFGHLAGCERIVYGVGWSGNGVGPSVVGGKILASLALGRRDEWSQAGLVGAHARRFPPEPIRYLGAHVVREAIVRKERSEALGLAPNRVAVALASLAPSGLEDKTGA